MSKKLYVLIALVALLAVPALAEEKVDDIIAKNIETRGGEKALKAVKTAHMTGTFNMGGGMEVPVEMTFKRPAMMRFEMEMQGMKMIQAYDGEKGWGVMPMMGSTEPEYLADDQLKQVKQMADFDGPLMDYADKGHSVELLGKEEIDGTEAYKVKLTTADGDVIYNYLDTDHFLVFKQEAKVNVQGNEMSMSTIVSDYKEVGSIVIPHSLEQIFEGAPAGMVITIKEIELDVDVDESIFAFPEKEDAGEEGSEEKEG